MTPREQDALLLCRDALRLAGEHLRMHPAYNNRLAAIIETAEREAEKALEKEGVEA